MTTPDFEELRAKRNAAVKERTETIWKELGGEGENKIWSTFNPNACYCACGIGGPCEHKWDGDEWMSDDGCASSVTCSRCGMTAMSHDMRCLP